MNRLAIIAFLALAACGATSEGHPAIVVSEGYAMVMRETGCSIGVKTGPAVSLSCTAKWGK